jgi:hypothetical protein
MRRRSPMSFRSLLVMFSGLFMQNLKHGISLPGGGREQCAPLPTVLRSGRIDDLYAKFSVL